MLNIQKRRCKKRLLVLAFSLCIAAVLLAPLASAETGVGLSWNTERVDVKEGEEKCIMYGVYNPWSEDAAVKLFLVGEIDNFVSSQSSEKVFVRSNTPHQRSQLVEICFEVEQVYEDDCLVGGMFCEQACRGEPVTYDGEVLAAGMSMSGEHYATGSATEFGVAAPLEVTVECVPRAMDLRVAYYGSAIMALSLASYFFYRKKLKKPKYDTHTAMLFSLLEC